MVTPRSSAETRGSCLRFPEDFPKKSFFSPERFTFTFRHNIMPSGSSPLAAALGRPAVGGAYTLKVEKLS